MSEYTGTLLVVELCSTLWLVPLAPLLAAVACVFAPKRAARWSWIAAAAAFALAVAHAIELSWLASGQRCLFDHLFNLARIGSLSVAFDLALDPLSAILIVLVSGVAALAIARAADARDGREVGAYNLMLGAMLVLLLADNLVVFIIGWDVLALAIYWIFARPASEQNLRGARTFYVVNWLGDGALIAGAAILFWALGGGFGPRGHYVPNYRPPLLGVRVVKKLEKRQEASKPPASGGGAGELAMTALPGATLHTGGARLCRLDSQGNRGGYGTPASPCRSAARPPFVHLPLPAVVYDLTIDAGPGESPMSIRDLRIDPGATTEIIQVGPTLSFRAMRDQLHVFDAGGHAVFRQELTRVTLWGMPALSVALFFFLMAAAARSALWPLHVWLGALTRVRPSAGVLIAGPIGLASGAYLFARLAFYLPLAPTIALLGAVLGALTALLAACGALFAGSLRRALGLFAIGQVGLVFVGLGVGAFAAAVLELVIATLSLVALWFGATSAERAQKTEDADEAADFVDLAGIGAGQPVARAYSWAALAAVAAPLPALGVFWSREALIWRAFSGPNALVGGLVALLGALASLALSYAVWRTYYLTFSGSPRRTSKKAKTELARFGGWLAVLGVLALVAGLAGFSGRAWGLDFSAPIAQWLPPIGASSGERSLGVALRAVVMAVSFGLPFFGWLLARKRYGSSRAEDWHEAEQGVLGYPLLSRAVELSSAYDARFARSAEWVGDAVARVDAALDRASGHVPAGDRNRNRGEP